MMNLHIFHSLFLDNTPELPPHEEFRGFVAGISSRETRIIKEGAYIMMESPDELFCKRVYEIAAQIPRGKVMTYGQIALQIGNPKAGREVGRAMALTPSELQIPCHRVVNKSGAMAPDYVFGGADKQRAMLEREGVTFKADGCINMAKHLWQSEPQQPSLQGELFS
jgi:methylated-DNA-protein-cysteine methyltransferase-like protein